MNFTLFQALIAFLYGAVFGSFLNVCIYRIPMGQSLLFPGSSCPECKSPISWFDNIPILSYFILRGKCRKCGLSFSARYPLIEFITALLSALLYMKFGFSLELAYFALFGYAMVVLIFIDYDHRILPNSITLPGAILGFSGSFFVSKVEWTDSLIGMISGPVFFLLLISFYYLARKKEGMGMGDVKMAATIGAFLGWKLLLLTVILASILGSAIGATIILLRKDDFDLALPFGTFLGITALFSLLWGTPIVEWYTRLCSMGYS